jgi:hypothetical protein
MVKLVKNWYHNGDRMWKIVFYSTQLISLIMILVSFFIPPLAVIDASIFAGVGELAFFPSLLAFYNIVTSGRKASISKGETTISVNDNSELITDGAE